MDTHLPVRMRQQGNTKKRLYVGSYLEGVRTQQRQSVLCHAQDLYFYFGSLCSQLWLLQLGATVWHNSHNSLL